MIKEKAIQFHPAPWIIAAALFIEPFAQIGVSFYASGASLVLLLILSVCAPQAWRGLTYKPAIFVVFLLFFINLLFSHGTNFAADFLRDGREGVFFLVMAAVLWVGRPIAPARITKFALAAAFCIIIPTLLFIIYQFLLIKRGQYVTLPTSWFVANGNTIPTALDLYYSKIRPSATFGEPSYLAFVLLSIIMMVSPAILVSRATLLLVSLCLCVGLVSQSASFVAYSAILLIAILWRPPVAPRGRVIRERLILFGGGIFLTGVLALGLASRFSNSAQRGADASADTRFWGPLLAFPQYLADHPLGLPWNSLDGVLSAYVAGGPGEPAARLDNAILTILYMHGWLGFVILGYFFLVPKLRLLSLFLLLAANFNGELFSVDKAAMLLMVATVYPNVRSYAQRRESREVTRRAQLSGKPRSPARASSMAYP